MINPKELRIGNLIFSETKAKPVYVTHRIISDLASHAPLPYQPILITAEWLLRCGFEISSDEYGGWLSPSVNDERWRVRPADGHFYWKLEMSTTPVIFSGVHHLQNWFYFLTGEELTVKEKV